MRFSARVLTKKHKIFDYFAVPINLNTVFKSRLMKVARRAVAFVSQFDGVDFDKCTLYVPRGSRELYMVAEGWREFANIVEVDAEEIVIPVAVIETFAGNHSLADGYWYSLTGQRIDNPAKGLYIRNGKKVIIK